MHLKDRYWPQLIQKPNPIEEREKTEKIQEERIEVEIKDENLQALAVQVVQAAQVRDPKVGL